MNSQRFAPLVTKGTPLATNGHDCPKFESPVSGNVIQIGNFGNQWQAVTTGGNECHLFGSWGGGVFESNNRLLLPSVTGATFRARYWWPNKLQAFLISPTSIR